MKCGLGEITVKISKFAAQINFTRFASQTRCENSHYFAAQISFTRFASQTRCENSHYFTSQINFTRFASQTRCENSHYFAAQTRHIGFYCTEGIEKKNSTPSGKLLTPYSKFCIDRICATIARPNPEPLYFAL